MGWVENLQADVEGVFATKLDERVGRKIPATEDVALKDGSVAIEAAFLYADLAGSSKLASVCPWSTTAKIVRAYLKVSTRLIRAWGGDIRSFDGDRVMGVFVGDAKTSNAARCAREIHWCTTNIIQAKAKLSCCRF